MIRRAMFAPRPGPAQGRGHVLQRRVAIGNEGEFPSCAAGVRVVAVASMLTAPPPIKGLMMPPAPLQPRSLDADTEMRETF